MSGPRFALYFAPEQDSALHAFGSGWLGRDAIAGTELGQPAVPGIAPGRFSALTEEARRYGFHATLKAPFELAAGVDPDRLIAEAHVFAAKRTAFEVRLGLANLGGFFALMLAEPSAEMAALADGCVSDFDHLRAPLSDHDLARRRKSALSARQDALLTRWGYPYVMEEFRFHMTLSARMPEGPERTAFEAALVPLADAATASPIVVDSICVFRQPSRDLPFHLAERLPFAR